MEKEAVVVSLSSADAGLLDRLEEGLAMETEVVETIVLKKDSTTPSKLSESTSPVTLTDHQIPSSTEKQQVPMEQEGEQTSETDRHQEDNVTAMESDKVEKVESRECGLKYRTIVEWFRGLWKKWEVKEVRCVKEKCQFRMESQDTTQSTTLNMFSSVALSRFQAHVISHMGVQPFLCLLCSTPCRSPEGHAQLDHEGATPHYTETDPLEFVAVFQECFPTMSQEDMEMFVQIFQSPSDGASSSPFPLRYSKALNKLSALYTKAGDSADSQLTCNDCDQLCVPRKKIRLTILDGHVVSHFSRPAYFCKVCHEWIDTVWDEHERELKHFENPELDPKTIYLDLRRAYQSSLLKILDKCFSAKSLVPTIPTPPPRTPRIRPQRIPRDKTPAYPQAHLYEETLQQALTQLEAQFGETGSVRCRSLDCAKQFTSRPTLTLVENHTVAHLGIPVYQCSVCNEQVLFIVKHFRKNHKEWARGQEDSSIRALNGDLRHKYERKLIRTLTKCFIYNKQMQLSPKIPKRGSYTFATNTTNEVVRTKHPKQYLDLLKGLFKSSRARVQEGLPVRCGFPDCDHPMDKAYLNSLERHMVKHLKHGLYLCLICNKEVKRIDDHKRHGPCSRKTNLRFQDMRAKYERELVALMKKCFPWHF